MARELDYEIATVEEAREICVFKKKSLHSPNIAISKRQNRPVWWAGLEELSPDPDCPTTKNKNWGIIRL